MKTMKCRQLPLRDHHTNQSTIFMMIGILFGCIVLPYHIVLISTSLFDNEQMTQRPQQEKQNLTLQNININNFSGIHAQSFVSNNNESRNVPCYPSNPDWSTLSVRNSPVQRGFFYLKPYKTGSSTTSGVHLRIARNVAQRQGTNELQQPQLNTSSTGSASSLQICESRFDHGADLHAGYNLFRNRIMNESFLWTILRDPTKRAISQFFHFEVSRKKIDPTDVNFIEFLHTSYATKDYYFCALYTNDIFNRNTMNPIDTANDILRTYDFIGITERIDESFVVLMILLNLKMSDILYLSAKSKGGFDDGGDTDIGCTYIWPSFVSNGVQRKDRVQYDTLLYQAANRSLDMTIDDLGRDRFNQLYQKYLYAKKIADEKCYSKAIFSCDTGGKFYNENQTDCIWNDSGCGVSCLDTVATELNLW
jgi:hypothetical protein